MLSISLVLFLGSMATLFWSKFNAVYGILLSFIVYHHSLVMVPFFSEENSYSDWVDFTSPDVGFLTSIVLVFVIISGFIVSLTSNLKVAGKLHPKFHEIQAVRLSSCASLVAMLSVIYVMRGTLQFSKQELFSSHLSYVSLLQYPLMIVLLASVLTKDKISIIIAFLAVAIFSVVLISRSTLVLPLLSIIFYYIYGSRLLEYITVVRIFFIFIIGVFGVYGKVLFLSLRSSDFSILTSHLQTFDFTDLMESMEGYSISYYIVDIINYRRDYDWTESLDALLQFLVVPSFFGADSQSFTRYLSENYRPDANYGLAYTYFGEGFAVGGFYGVTVWTFIIVLIASLIHLILRYSNSIWINAWCFFH